MDQSQEPNVDEPRPETPDEQFDASADGSSAADQQAADQQTDEQQADEQLPVEPTSAEPEDVAEPVAEAIEQAEEATAEEEAVLDGPAEAAETVAADAGAEQLQEAGAEVTDQSEADESEADESEADAEADETEEEAEPAAEPASAELIAAVEEAFEDVDVAAVEAEAAEGEEEEAPVDDWQPGDWFVVHTYAGYENKVKANLETRIVSMNMEEKIFEVVIPMEDVMEMKGGKKQMVQRKVFPGYLLVRMDLDDDSWYVVRNTPGVTGFVGSGSKPIPLSTAEVDRILQRGAAAEEERPRPKPEWQVNDPVRVTTGPFANFQGVVSEVDLDRSKLKVLVNIFGRETPVELGFDQVAKV